MIINTASFELTSTKTESFGIVEEGTIEVTIRRETRRLRAVITTPTYAEARTEADIRVYGLTGRYNTGKKAWPAVLTQSHWKSGEVTESVYFGRDERVGRCNKLNYIFFA